MGLGASLLILCRIPVVLANSDFLDVFCNIYCFFTDSSVLSPNLKMVMNRL